MDGHSSSAAHTMGPRVHFSSVCEQSHWWPTSAYSYQWFKQRLILSVSELSISQRSQIKDDTVERSVPALEFNLKAYAVITWYNDSASLCLEPRLADHSSQAAHTTSLPTVPSRQADAVAQIRVEYKQSLNSTNSAKILSHSRLLQCYTYWLLLLNINKNH